MQGARTGRPPTARTRSTRSAGQPAPRKVTRRHVRRARTRTERAGPESRVARQPEAPGSARAVHAPSPWYPVLGAGAEDWSARKADLPVLLEGANRWTDNLPAPVLESSPSGGIGANLAPQPCYAPPAPERAQGGPQPRPAAAVAGS